MKRALVLTFTILLLASCKTLGPALTDVTFHPAPPGDRGVPGHLTGLCSSNDAIYLIVVNENSELKRLTCPPTRRKPNLEEKEKSDPYPHSLPAVKLGEIQKFKPSATDPDPCIEWVIDGDLMAFCW